jgi:flagellar basal-body rod protein FlgB
MLESMFDRGSVPALELILSWSSARHRVIAANVANAQTPGYRAQDLSEREFRSALARALAGGPAATGLVPRPAETAGIVKPDGNNVDLEVEMGRMARNGMLHTFAATLLAQQLGQMREAVAERVIG